MQRVADCLSDTVDDLTVLALIHVVPPQCTIVRADARTALTHCTKRACGLRGRSSVTRATADRRTYTPGGARDMKVRDEPAADVDVDEGAGEEPS